MSDRRHPVGSAPPWGFWPRFLLKTPKLFRTFLDLSGFGFLRLACGTAVKSVRISTSVCGMWEVAAPFVALVVRVHADFNSLRLTRTKHHGLTGLVTGTSWPGNSWPPKALLGHGHARSESQRRAQTATRWMFRATQQLGGRGLARFSRRFYIDDHRCIMLHCFARPKP